MWPLTRIGFIWLHDSNPMVREFEVSARQLQCGHMAGHAVVAGDPTRFRPVFPATTACLTFRIVIDRLITHLAVRIMAGQPTNSRVVWVVALTVCQPVRLETNICDARLLEVLETNKRPECSRGVLEFGAVAPEDSVMGLRRFPGLALSRARQQRKCRRLPRP